MFEIPIVLFLGLLEFLHLIANYCCWVLTNQALCLFLLNINNTSLPINFFLSIIAAEVALAIDHLVHDKLAVVLQSHQTGRHVPALGLDLGPQLLLQLLVRLLLLVLLQILLQLGVEGLCLLCDV